MSILDKYLEMENSDKLYNYMFSYKNTLMYPFVRFKLLRAATIFELKISHSYDSLSSNTIQNFVYKLKSFWYFFHAKKQSDIVFFGSDISNIRLGNVYYNRLTENFANEYPEKTILLESSEKKNYKRPRTYSKVFSRDFLTISAKKSSSASIDQKDLEQINFFLQFLKEYYSSIEDEAFWEKIKKALIRHAIMLPFLYNEYQKFFKKVSPKIIFLDCACYGGSNIPLIMAAKDLGISVAEYQHGHVSLAHPAYNYSSQLPTLYKYYLPEFFMSYGKYWIENSRIPIMIYEIGNPYLSDTVLQRTNITKKRQILYISFAPDPEHCVKEIIYLNKLLSGKEYTIVFRIHPKETLRLHTVYKPIIDAGISIDTQPLYETLNHTMYVIGNFSTVLFEAVMFDCIVFVRDNLCNRENMAMSKFNVFCSIENLVDDILSKNYKTTEKNDLWANDWREKYRQLINSLIG